MNFKTGKLYQVKKYFWFLYPSKDIAAGQTAQTAQTEASASATAAHWSKYFKCNVSYIPENSIFCLIEKDGKFLKVLSTSGELGWMIYSESENWAKDTIEELKET